MKTKTDKRINKKIKAFNKTLEKDVFRNRFWVRQYQKQTYDHDQYYLYELCDRLEPERNRVIYKWLRGNSVFFMSDIFDEMNSFILESDFWELYRKGV